MGLGEVAFVVVLLLDIACTSLVVDRCHGAKQAGSPSGTAPDTDVIEARFLDLIPNAKVIYAVDFVSEDSAFDEAMVMRWCVSRIDGGTLVEVVAENVPDAVSEADHAAGLQSSLAKLAACLAKPA